MNDLLMRLWESANQHALLHYGVYIDCERPDDEMKIPNSDEELIAKVIIHLDRIT